MVILKGKRNGACIIHSTGSLIFPLIMPRGAGAGVSVGQRGKTRRNGVTRRVRRCRTKLERVGMVRAGFPSNARFHRSFACNELNE